MVPALSRCAALSAGVRAVDHAVFSAPASATAVAPAIRRAIGSRLPMDRGATRRRSAAPAPPAAARSHAALPVHPAVGSGGSGHPDFPRSRTPAARSVAAGHPRDADHHGRGARPRGVVAHRPLRGADHQPAGAAEFGRGGAGDLVARGRERGRHLRDRGLGVRVDGVADQQARLGVRAPQRGRPAAGVGAAGGLPRAAGECGLGADVPRRAGHRRGPLSVPSQADLGLVVVVRAQHAGVGVRDRDELSQ